MNCIGIVAAMPVEAAPIIKHFDLKEQKTDGFDCYLSDKIILIISGMGIINSTLATFVLLDRFHCTRVINYGVCGYTGDEYDHCTVFSVGKLYKRDLNFTALGFAPYRFPDEPDHIAVPADARLPILPLYTSDEFVGPKSDVPKGVLVDMEGYCVANVCGRFGTPCSVYKCVSDKATEGETEKQLSSHLTDAIDALCDFLVSNVL